MKSPELHSAAADEIIGIQRIILNTIEYLPFAAGHAHVQDCIRDYNQFPQAAVDAVYFDLIASGSIADDPQYGVVITEVGQGLRQNDPYYWPTADVELPH